MNTLSTLYKSFRRLLLPIAFVATICAASANNNMREWKLASGDRYQAELVSYNETEKFVILRQADQTELRLNYDALSAFDRAWLLEWVEYGDEMHAMLEKLGGKLTRHISTGKYTLEYSVFQPTLKNPVEGTKPPMMILFHPSGNGHREIMRYLEAADAVGMTIVSCEYFRNGPPITATQRVPELENDLLARFNELLPHIEANVPHDAKRMFMGGCSGGAWRSFHYAAQVDRPWAGVYSNGGWLGGEIWYDLPYPKMRVALVDGNQDPGGSYRDRDTERLQKAGCKVSIHAFEGGHQIPPPSVQQKAFRWLLSEE